MQIRTHRLLGTALLNDLNLGAYLRHVLERITDLRISRITELLPWNVKDKIAVEITTK